jgi:arsenical pump membrane protein
MGQMLVGGLIFIVTLAVIMIRPYGVTEAVAASMGAGLMLLLGFVRLDEAARLLGEQWNVYGFFLGLMTISALTDRAGVFEWVAFQAGKWGRGNGRRLYIVVFLVGAVITMFLSNDATALILTPVVYALVTRLRLPVLPFMFACTFIADTASFLLPVSNPVNILVLDAFPANLGAFLHYLFLPALLCITFNVAIFVWLYRKDLNLTYPERSLVPFQPADARFFRFVLGALGVIALAYVLASALQIPLSVVALGGACALAAGAFVFRQWAWSQLRREIAWSIFIFITGLFILVRGVEDLGLTAAFGQALVGLAANDPLRGILLTAAGTALGANLINNVPMTLVGLSALKSVPDAVSVNPALAYATILGADLGPNLTTVGSLATMLWLLILRRKGLDVSTREYFKLGITVVPVMILLSSLLIWLRW